MITKMQNAKTKIALSVLSGILLAVIQPPTSLFPIAYMSLIPLFFALEKNGFRHNFIMGFITGVAAHLGQIYWVVIAMNRYGGIDIYTSVFIMLLLVFYLAIYIACFAALSVYLEDSLFVPVYISAPFIWVLLEYIRGIFFTGFPWSFLAHSQHNVLSLIQIVSVTGTYFLSFLIVAVNCIIYQILNALYERKRKKGSWVLVFQGSRDNTGAEKMLNAIAPRRINACFVVYVSVVLGLLGISFCYGYARLQSTHTGDLKAAIIQGNIRQDVKWDEAFKIKTINTYLQKTGEFGRNSDIVVWPETAMPFVFDDAPHINKFIKEAPTLLNTNLLFGTVSKDKFGRYRNSAYFYQKDGQLAGTYSKVHLVPFGEYTPLISYLPFLSWLTAAGGNFVPGESHSPINTSLGKIGILICYEGTFPSITIETVRRGAQVLVNLTNDAWYDKTSAPYQHLVFYVFRAIESDRYVLRAANTGISTIIDPRGRINRQTGLFEEGAYVGTFSLKNEKTAYVAYGDCFVLFSFLFLLAACASKTLIRKQ